MEEQKKCKRLGCLKSYKESENHSQACKYHPGKAILQDNKKSYTCCEAFAVSWEQFQKIKPCAVGYHSEIDSQLQSFQRHHTDKGKNELFMHKELRLSTEKETKRREKELEEYINSTKGKETKYKLEKPKVGKKSRLKEQSPIKLITQFQAPIDKQEKQPNHDEYDVFAEPLLKKKAKPKPLNEQNDTLQNQRNDQLNQIRVPLFKINVQKTFHDILYEATKSPIMLRSLRQVLSQGHKELNEKRKYYQFKWSQLQNLNCSRNDYAKQENELKQLQQRDISEIQAALMQNLAEKGFQAFKSKDDILNEFRQNYIDNRMKESKGPMVEEIKFYINMEEAQQLKTDQTTLLERLMAEQQLIEPIDELQSKSLSRTNRLYQDNQQRQQDEQRQEFENQQQAYTLCDKLNVQKIINEKLRNINVNRIDVLMKIFKTFKQDLLKLEEPEYIIIQKNIRVMLLDSKSDEVYTDKEFQRIQNDKYTALFQNLKSECPSDYKRMSEQQLDFLLELTTYLVNNAHYQQKYKQPPSTLLPKDVTSLLDRIYKGH